MQRTASVLLASLFAGFLLTGCPEKKVEKEEPSAPTAVDKSGTDERDKAEEEHGEEQADEHAEEPKDEKKAATKKKKPAAEEKDPGGW